jgi:hypothetical protein
MLIEWFKSLRNEFFQTSNANPTDWSFNVLKGRIAETIVEELFQTSGKYIVNRFGMENMLPKSVMMYLGKSRSAMNIRKMPDFVIQEIQTGRVFFIEVKFRASECFKRKDLPQDYPYENAYIILISKNHIKCVSFEELERGEEITPTSKNYLGNRKEFDLDKTLIKDFCEFAKIFYAEI